MTDVLDVLSRLPKVCAARHPSTGRPTLLQRGVTGYWSLPGSFPVDAFNERHGVTVAQQKAMLAGSMFGWGIPAADPRTWEGH